jgi:DNA-binding HxlR family transcriptional regulator
MTADGSDEWQRTWHLIQRALGGKWALHVLHVVARGPRRFGDLRREIDGVSEATLSRRLSDLREAGFVERTVTPESSPHAAYRPTAAGERVAAFLDEMEALASVAEGDGADGDGEGDGDGPRLVFDAR